MLKNVGARNNGGVSDVLYRTCAISSRLLSCSVENVCQMVSFKQCLLSLPQALHLPHPKVAVSRRMVDNRKRARLRCDRMTTRREQLCDTSSLETSLGKAKRCSQACTSCTSTATVSGETSRCSDADTYTTIASYSCSNRGYFPDVAQFCARRYKTDTPTPEMWTGAHLDFLRLCGVGGDDALCNRG